MTSSDQCFYLPFYPRIWRAAFALPARSRCKHAAGLGPCPGERQNRRGHRGCTIRAGSGVSDLHSPQWDENPPAADGARSGGRPPPPARVCSGVGKASWPGPGWRLAEELTPARRHPGPAAERLLLGRGWTPAAGQPDARPGCGLGPAAAGGFIPLIASGTKPAGELPAGTTRPRRATDRRA